MECNKCHNKWETNRRTPASLAACPFCGEDLVCDGEGKHKIFNNSKDALILIAKQHGNDMLLGKQLKSLFPDYAPPVSRNIKELVFAVYDKGAASILRSNLNAKLEDKEIAFKRAVARLTDAFIAKEAAEKIIYEFVEALGWQLSVPFLKQRPDVQSQSQQSAQSAQSQTQQPQQRPRSVYQAGTDIASAIIQGKNRNLEFGGYVWRVLDVQDDRAFLLTEDIVDRQPYNTKPESVIWGTCTLRQYLNGEFYERFSKQEQAVILEVDNTNADNQWYGTKGGDDTKDKVFLLSIEEAVKYFGDSGQLQKRPKKDDWRINDKYNSDRIAGYQNKAWWWWLRSLGDYSDYAAIVYYGGGLRMNGLDVSYEEGGVRPALWLNL